MEEITFTPGSVPVVVVARVYGKDASWYEMDEQLPNKADGTKIVGTAFKDYPSRYSFLDTLQDSKGGEYP